MSDSQYIADIRELDDRGGTSDDLASATGSTVPEALRELADKIEHDESLAETDGQIYDVTIEALPVET